MMVQIIKKVNIKIANFTDYIHSRNFPLIPIFLGSIIFRLLMDIQHHSNSQKQLAIKSLYELYESDGDLVQQLVTVINSLFSPLAWILEETLYRRIKKQDKGWIELDYLNRNPKIINIFKDNGIHSKTRRKHNLLVHAIKRSILKKKKSFIKRKVYLNVNIEMKKVIYFESNTITSPSKINLTSQMQVQPQNGHIFIALTKTNLKSMIKSVILELQQNKRQNSIDEQQIQMNSSNGSISSRFNVNDIEFYGTFMSDFKQKNIDLSVNNSKQQPKQSKEEQYRWCFVYFPQMPISIVEFIQKRLKQAFSGPYSKQKTGNANDSSGYSVQTYSLKEMVEKFCPKYDQVCKAIGYLKKDQHQERLKMKNKQKQRQKIRLLESVDLDKKIDVQNQYHVKLQIEKQRKGYLKNKQAEYERKMRLRELKKINKSQFKIQDAELKKDTFTEKLKSLLGLKNQETQKQVPKASQQLQNQDEKNKNEEKEIIKTQHQQIQEDTSKIQINLPKYVENQALNIQVDQKNGENQFENQVYESFFDDQGEYQSSQSSSEEYEIPKKKTLKKTLHKKKKILKSHEKDFNQVKSEPKAIGIPKESQKQKRVSENSQKSSKSISNTTYNLRHKTHSQGSYLKMIEPIEDGASQKHTPKIKNDKFSKKFQNLIDEHHSITNSRSLRSKKKQNDK